MPHLATWPWLLFFFMIWCSLFFIMMTLHFSSIPRN